MEATLQYEVHSKEKLYFAFKLIAAIAGYASIYFLITMAIESAKSPLLIVVFFYTGLIVMYLFFRLGLLVGHIKGNGVKITERQFPEIYNIVVNQSRLLNLRRVPDVYLLQSGGILNAFATKFFGSNYIVIYSEVLEEAFENNIEAVEFIIGHELGHIKRNHMTKSLLLFPALFIPFLGSAYSRGCELTCDNIGAALNSKGIKPGLMILASGKKLWKKVSYDRFIEQEQTEDGFWFWFSEKISSHPHLTKRLNRFRGLPTVATSEKIEVKEVVSDHASFMPR